MTSVQQRAPGGLRPLDSQLPWLRGAQPAAAQPAAVPPAQLAAGRLCAAPGPPAAAPLPVRAPGRRTSRTGLAPRPLLWRLRLPQRMMLRQPPPSGLPPAICGAITCRSFFGQSLLIVMHVCQSHTLAQLHLARELSGSRNGRPCKIPPKLLGSILGSGFCLRIRATCETQGFDGAESGDGASITSAHLHGVICGLRPQRSEAAPATFLAFTQLTSQIDDR